MSVNPGQAGEYRRRHNPIWTDLAEVLRTHGAHNYSIFHDERTGHLFAYVEIEDDARALAHLLDFDSTYGRISASVEFSGDSIIVGGKPIAVASCQDPAAIDWGRFGADIVIESTGRFCSRDDAAVHLKGGARKVLISAPGKNADITVVVGINDGDYDPRQHDVISNASCTTNCVAPMAKVLHDNFGLGSEE